MIRPFILICCMYLAFSCTSPDPRSLNADSFKVVMVLDMAGLGDKGFNDLGWAGVQRAISKLNVEGRYIQSNEQADYVANLSLAAQQANVVVAMGFLMHDAVKKVAKLFPETSFIFIDGEITGDNIASFDFKAQEGAYLAGIVAAITSRSGKVGSILGMDIPPVRAYEAGFRAGVMTANLIEGKHVGYTSATVGDFNNPSRAKALALGLIGQGADVVLQIAGNSGLGVIEAVREADNKVWAIGADMDQDDLVPGSILVSILKRIDVAVFEAIRSAHSGQFRTGHNWIGLAEGATELTEMRHTRNDVPDRAMVLIARAEALIRNGDLVVPWRIEDLEAFQPPAL